MSLKQTIYFMALVGGLAGLICWAIVVWIPDAIPVRQESSWMIDLLDLSILGLLISGLTVLFADRWSGDQVVPRWVISGLFIGLLAGVLSGLIRKGIGEVLSRQKLWALIASWMIAGASIGFGTGLRWAAQNKIRVLHALGGGLFGGVLGGIVFAFLPGGMAGLPQAMGYMITGIGITCGVTLAPVLFRDGVLRFMSSGDARAQNKYGPTRKEWEIHDGDMITAGSLRADHTRTKFSQEIQIYIPDAMVAPRHAAVLGRKRRFFLEQHPENRGPQGQPLYPLQLRGQDVLRPQELHDGDDIVIGQTLLRFETRKKHA